jgi:hypothetical protein
MRRPTVFRPRVPPSYNTSLDKPFTTLDARWQVNAHTADRSSVLRFYRIEANDGAWSGAPP